MGGRLTGISLIAHLGGWVLGDHPLHVSVADNAARLRTQQNRFRRLDVADTRGVVVHWDDADIGQRGGATAVDILDALVKVVLDEPAETALACLDWALHTRLIDDLDFERLLVRLPARARWVAGWVDPACESLPESLARTRLRLAGHTVVSQVRLGDLERIDLVVDGVVALEVDGEEHHLLRFERDRAKDLRITCATFHGLRPSARMIFNDWAGVLAAIQVALRERGRPPRVPLHFAGNSGVRRRRRRQTVAAAGRGPTGPRPGPEFPSEGVAGQVAGEARAGAGAGGGRGRAARGSPRERGRRGDTDAAAKVAAGVNASAPDAAALDLDPAAEAPPRSIKVDIWSDVQCPWCYIGKRKFEAGVAEFVEGSDGVAVEVEYHSFELAPDTPVDFAGSPADYLSQRKGLPMDQVEQMLERVVGIATDVGLDYHYDQVHQTNTIKAHELLHYAKAKGRQLDMKERLLKAYFVDGRHVGLVPELADLAAEVGLDRADVERALNEEEFLGAVKADVAMAAHYGIQGVPFFVFDGRYGVSGAQDPSTFANVLSQVRDESEFQL